MKKYAWCTYANDETYFRAACVLHTILKAVGTRHEFVLILPSTATFDPPPPPDMIVFRVKPFDVHGAKHMATRYTACSNKIHAWRLTTYDAICWLDSDIVITQPIDDLFNTPFHAQGIAGAPGCRCNIFRNKKLPTLPHECPFNTNQTPPYINTGVMLLHPSVSIYRRLRKINYDHPFPDQDAFNLFFTNKITVLNSAYNYMNHLPLVHPDIPTTNIKIYHFCYGKPWEHGVMSNKYYSLWKKYKRSTHIKQI